MQLFLKIVQGSLFLRPEKNILLTTDMNYLKIIVLAKQVPDTRNVGKDAMKEDGTVNQIGRAHV